MAQKQGVRKLRVRMPPVEAVAQPPALRAEVISVPHAVMSANDHLPTDEELSSAALAGRPNFDALIRKSNALVEARYALTLNAQRILCFAISKIDRNQIESNQPLLKIPVTHIAEAFPALNNGTLYSDIDKGAAALFDSKIEIEEGKRGWMKYRWVQRCGRMGGVLYIRLAQDVIPYLVALRERYSQYRLRYVMQLSSANSFRFYELFQRYEFVGTKVLYFEDLKSWLLVPKDEYKSVGHFKARVLDPSIRAVNDTDLTIEIIDVIRLGKRVIGWEFKISRKPQEQLPLPPSVAPVVERLVNLGFSPPEAMNFAKKYDTVYLEKQIAWVEKESESGDIQSLTGFLRQAIQHEWQPAPGDQNEKREAIEAARKREREAQDAYQRELSSARDRAPFEIRIREAMSRYDALSVAARQEAERLFAANIADHGTTVAAHYADRGLKDGGPFVKAAFNHFLFKHLGVPEPTQAQIQDYLSTFFQTAAVQEQKAAKS